MNEGFTAQGEVNLAVATIGSFVVCTGGKFVSSEKSLALEAAGAKIQGFVLLNRDLGAKDGFSAEGGVRFTSATIGGDLYCEGCRLAGSKSNARALDAQSVKLDGRVYFPSDASVDGVADFTYATIARDFYWAPNKLSAHSLLELRHAKVGSYLWT